MASISPEIGSSLPPEIKEQALPQKFNFKKNLIAIVKLDDYKPQNIRKALIEIIELLDLKEIFEGKSILLKPNVLAPTKLAYTPPEILSELIDVINEGSSVKEIFIGDSTMTKKLTDITLKRGNFIEKCEGKCKKILNFFESERVDIKLNNPTHEAQEHIYLPKEIVEADLIINVPKLKTHNGFVYTGAIKNFFGLLGNKMNMHMIYKNKEKFQKMLADIYFAVEETNDTKFPKVLTIMDAVIAMEGKGPRAGKPRKVGLLIAGFNSAAVDIVGYTLMNGNPKDLDAINSLARRTELPVDIDQLEIVGEKNYKSFIVKDFKKPNIAILKKREVQDRFSKISDKVMSISIKIDKKKCVLCEQCIEHCPAEAMVRKNDTITIERDKCIECFCCGESCPNGAISAKWYLFRIMPLLIILIGMLGLAAVYGIWQLIVFILSLF